MKRFQLAILLAGVLSVGCRDRELLQPAALGAPMAVIMDGAHDGNAFFFFLPPLVPNPSSFFHAGKFNAGLSPVAEVCELTGDPSVPGAAPTCVATVFGPAKMALDLAAQQYAVNWDTKSSSLISTKFYRILVRGAARGTVLGFVDIDPVDQGVKNLKTGDVIAFQDGRTLPIKVRIEKGWNCVKLDVRLRNAGTETVNVTRADLHVMKRVPYAGVYKASARYDLILEAEHNMVALAHVLQPNEVDRFVLRVGFSKWNTSCGFEAELILSYNGGYEARSKRFQFSSTF